MLHPDDRCLDVDAKSRMSGIRTLETKEFSNRIVLAFPYDFSRAFQVSSMRSAASARVPGIRIRGGGTLYRTHSNSTAEKD